MFSFICRDFTLTDYPTPIGRQADRQIPEKHFIKNTPTSARYTNPAEPLRRPTDPTYHHIGDIVLGDHRTTIRIGS